MFVNTSAKRSAPSTNRWLPRPLRSHPLALSNDLLAWYSSPWWLTRDDKDSKHRVRAVKYKSIMIIMRDKCIFFSNNFQEDISCFDILVATSVGHDVRVMTLVCGSDDYASFAEGKRRRGLAVSDEPSRTLRLPTCTV